MEDSNSSSSYQKREFAIEILDASNEAKFDRLLKEEKIKSPFRRHPSNNDTTSNDAELESIKNHDPSILDFKLAAPDVPLNVKGSIFGIYLRI